MKLISALSLRHLRQNRSRTLVTLIGIMIAVAMITAISGMVVSFQDMLYRYAVAEKGAWHLRIQPIDSETARQLIAEPVFRHGEYSETEEGPMVSLQFGTLNQGIYDVVDELQQRYGIPLDDLSYHTNLLIAEGILPGGYFEALYGFAAVLLSLVVVSAIMVISNAFTISADQRVQQFGLLRSAGATKAQIRDIVLFEGLSLSAIAIPLGIALGFAVEFCALQIANYFIAQTSGIVIADVPLGKAEASFRVSFSPWILAIAICATLVIVLLAAWFPAHRAARTNIVDAVRQSRAIEVQPRSVRVSPLTKLLFGFEGTLAAKTLGRNRSRYHTTIVSLVLSIVLFIAVSSFAELLLVSSGMVYIDMGSNLSVGLYGEDKEEQDRLADEIAAWDGLSLHRSRRELLLTELDPSFLTPQAEQLYVREYEMPLHSITANCVSIGESDFRQLCRQLGLDPEAMADAAQPQAILVNTSGVFYRDGKRTVLTPYRIPLGTSLTVRHSTDERFDMRVAAQIDEIPIEMLNSFSHRFLNLIVSEPVRSALKHPDQREYMQLFIMADDASVCEERLEALLSSTLSENTYNINNYERTERNTRVMTLLIAIFVYGFIAILSLIAATNIITTISTSISLRQREFAMLRSVGMTQNSMSRMLNYESLLYGLRALLIGLPLGLAVSLLMYHQLGLALEFSYIPPWSAMIISIVAVLLLVTATMNYARSKQRGFNIASTLRNETV